eukprot:6418973-Prymnesium_polylepis.3
MRSSDGSAEIQNKNANPKQKTARRAKRWGSEAPCSRHAGAGHARRRDAARTEVGGEGGQGPPRAQNCAARAGPSASSAPACKAWKCDQ